MSFGSKFIKKMNEQSGEDAFKKASDFNINDTTIFYKTNVPVLNALLSDGDLTKGFPCNKIVVLAGEQQTGKSFLMRAMEDAFLKGNPYNELFKFDSEGATTNKMMEDFGMDTNRIIIKTPKTVEEFRHETTVLMKDYLEAKKIGKKAFESIIDDIKPKKIIKDVEEFVKTGFEMVKRYAKDTDIVEEYIDVYNIMVEEYARNFSAEGFVAEAVFEKHFPKVMITLDSLGLLPTETEIKNAEENNNKADMGKRAQLIKGLFRLLTNQSNLAAIPMVIINHTYTGMMYATTKMSGGQGAYYAADIILFLHKSKMKNSDKKQIGISVRCKVEKSRFIREGSEMILEILFSCGLNRESSIFELAVETGMVKKLTSKSYQLDGTTDKLSKDEMQKYVEDLVDNEEFMSKLSKYVYDKYSLFSKNAEISTSVADLDTMLDELEAEEKEDNE